MWVQGFIGAWLYGCMGECPSSAAAVRVAGPEGDYSPSAAVAAFTRIPLHQLTRHQLNDMKK